MSRTRPVVAAVAAGLLAILPAAGPAAAHGTKLKLEVAGDGATGITVQARYADGHQLEETVRLVVDATAGGGRKVGPLQLEPAGEGQGFYSSGPVLTPGEWRVTVRAPAPWSGTATASVQAETAQSPPPAPAPAVPEDLRRPRWPWAVALSGVGVVLLAAAAILARRRRADPSSAG